MLQSINLLTKILITTVMGIFQFWGCFPSVSLPAEKPEDLRIRYFHGGGMSPYGIEFTINEGVCTYIQADMGNDHEINFPLTEQQQKIIYQAIKKANISSIRSRKTEVVFDYPTTSLKVSIPSLDFEKEVRNSATSHIIKSHQPRFKELLKVIKDEVENTLDMHTAQFEVEFEESAVEKMADFSVYSHFYSYKSEPKHLTGKLIPDTYEVDFFIKDENGHSKSANQVSLTIDREVKKLVVFYEEGKFGINVIRG